MVNFAARGDECEIRSMFEVMAIAVKEIGGDAALTQHNGGVSVKVPARLLNSKLEAIEGGPSRR